MHFEAARLRPRWCLEQYAARASLTHSIMQHPICMIFSLLIRSAASRDWQSAKISRLALRQSRMQLKRTRPALNEQRGRHLSGFGGDARLDWRSGLRSVSWERHSIWCGFEVRLSRNRLPDESQERSSSTMKPDTNKLLDLSLPLRAPSWQSEKPCRGRKGFTCSLHSTILHFPKVWRILKSSASRHGKVSPEKKLRSHNNSPPRTIHIT